MSAAAAGVAQVGLTAFVADGQEAWQEDALCAQVDPALFFPEKGGSTRQAKKVCGECPVREQCLAWAIEAGEEHGVWGGLSERERAAYARTKPRKPKMEFGVPTDAEISRQRARYATAPVVDQDEAPAVDQDQE